MQNLNILFFFFYFISEIVLYKAVIYNGKCLFVIDYSKVIDFHLLEKYFKIIINYSFDYLVQVIIIKHQIIFLIFVMTPYMKKKK